MVICRLQQLLVRTDQEPWPKRKLTRQAGNHICVVTRNMQIGVRALSTLSNSLAWRPIPMRNQMGLVVASGRYAFTAATVHIDILFLLLIRTFKRVAQADIE